MKDRNIWIEGFKVTVFADLYTLAGQGKVLFTFHVYDSIGRRYTKQLRLRRQIVKKKNRAT